MGGIVRALGGKTVNYLVCSFVWKNLIPLNLGIVRFLFLIKIISNNFRRSLKSFNKPNQNIFDKLKTPKAIFLNSEAVLINPNAKSITPFINKVTPLALLVALYSVLINCIVRTVSLCAILITLQAILINSFAKILTPDALLVSLFAVFVSKNATFVIKNAFFNSKFPFSNKINTNSPSFTHFSFFINIIGVVQ